MIREDILQQNFLIFSPTIFNISPFFSENYHHSPFITIFNNFPPCFTIFNKNFNILTVFCIFLNIQEEHSTCKIDDFQAPIDLDFECALFQDDEDEQY